MKLAFYEYITVKSIIQMTTMCVCFHSSEFLTAWKYLTNIKESVDETDTVFKHEAKCEWIQRENMQITKEEHVLVSGARIFVKERRRYVQMPLCRRTVMLNVEMIRDEQVNRLTTISIRSTISNFGFIGPSSWIILGKWPLKKQRWLHFLWLIPKKGQTLKQPGL